MSAQPPGKCSQRARLSVLYLSADRGPIGVHSLTLSTSLSFSLSFAISLLYRYYPNIVGIIYPQFRVARSLPPSSLYATPTQYFCIFYRPLAARLPLAIVSHRDIRFGLLFSSRASFPHFFFLFFPTAQLADHNICRAAANSLVHLGVITSGQNRVSELYTRTTRRL